MGRSCDKCGVFLAEDTLRYIVEIRVTADVPPTLDTDMSAAEIEAALRDILERVSTMSEEEAESQVHQRMTYLLCPRCRAIFVRDPLGACGFDGPQLH